MFSMYIQLGLLFFVARLMPVQGLCTITGSGTSFTWQSENYPSKYPKSMNCSFPYDTTAPRIVHYTMTEFELQDYKRGKCQDDVTFTKPFHKQIKVCGNQTGTVVSLPMGASSASFSSNDKIARKGFSIQIDYETTDYTKEYVLSSGGQENITITNPAYPRKERGHMAEYWVKTNETNRKIKLTFEVDIKKKQCCNQDYLVINRSGDPIYPKASSRLFCGIRKTYLVSKADKLCVSYRSEDPGNVKLTFSLTGSS